MPISKDYVILDCHTIKGKVEYVIMTYITEEEEQELDKGVELHLTRGNRRFTVNNTNVYCYGEVNFNKGSDDMKQLRSFSFLDYLVGVGVKIPADYDYDKHVCYSPIKSYMITETFKPDILAIYKHGCLGKPERIALFRYR